MAYLRHWSVNYLVPSDEMRVGASSEHKHNTPPCVVSKRWWVGRSFTDLGAESIGGRQRLLPTYSGRVAEGRCIDCKMVIRYRGVVKMQAMDGHASPRY
jgi:hypothetical protein